MIETIITCLITSKDLREIADKMEHIENHAKPGRSTIAHEWYLDNKTRIKFTLDQDRHYKQKKKALN